jgi:hypothetical protein
MDDQYINDCKYDFEAFLGKAIRITNGRKLIKPRAISYEAIGYLFKDFDEINTLRK